MEEVKIMKIIDCKSIREQMLNEAKIECKKIFDKYNEKPNLTVIQVGYDAASDVYIRNKIKTCDEVGIECEHIHVDEEITFDELRYLIENTCGEKTGGVMLQLPLPDHLKKYQQELLNIIPWYMDVDGLSARNVGRLWVGEKCITPATPTGIMRLLPKDLSGKRVAVIGRSNLVGKPLVKMVADRNGTVTLCHGKTGDLRKIISDSDIIVTAIGIPKYFDSSYCDPFDGKLWIDVGVNRDENGKLCGDVDMESFRYYKSSITPVPSGVGILTTAQLILNVIKAYNIFD